VERVHYYKIFNGSVNKIGENWEKPTFFIQDGGYLFTN